MALTGPLTSALTRALTGPLTSSAGVSGPTPILLMPLVNNLNLSIGIGSATFTRSSTGTFLDAGTGLITTASVDTARFEANGVLIEGASTNLLLRSEEFDNSSWIKVRASVSADSTTAPDGASTADKLVEDSTASSSHTITQNAATTANTVTAFSIFAKADGRSDIEIRYRTQTGTEREAVFDLSAGTANNGDAITATIEPFADDWYRCSITADSLSGASQELIRIFLMEGSNIVYSGDGSSGVFFWGAKLEELPFVSSYIQTVGTTVTRSPDNLSIDSDNIPVPTADYSVALTSDFTGIDSSASQVLFNVVGETSRRIEWNTTTGAIEATHGAVTSVSTSTFSPGDRVDIAFVVDGTNQTLYIDGVEEDQDAKGTATGTKTSINIGRQASTNQAYSHIKPLQIFDVALTPSEVAAL